MFKEYTAEERKIFFAKMQPVWEATGKEINHIRTELKVSKRYLAKHAGICVKTLTKVEKGQYIRRFKVVSQSCLNALELFGYKLDSKIKQILGI